ncbi:MAG: long-chain-fatty-acid--CoA ligase [Alphaproteobacteria bacterium]|nr:long-chain-fatty-acid--CoA ligase [Alphaproteobacteria bacterium]
MLGLMQDRPLLISQLLEYAAIYHPKVEIVSKTVEGPTHRSNYAEIHRRAKRAAKALAALGIVMGDRVATLAWNGYRHFELYYGISGMGAVCHTVNPRLFPEQIAYIANHAEDKALFFDLTFLPLVEKLAPQLKSVRHWVLMTDRAHMPKASSVPNLLCYEELLAAQSEDYAWPSFDERTASSLCYTSGTTGNPKGVLYAHRSTVLHSFAVCMGDTLALSSRDSVLVVVPMFHANAWGLVYAAPMCGAKLVLPGPHLDGPSVHAQIEAERCTMSAGVPTVWLALLNYLTETGKRIDTVKKFVIGGSAAPRSMIETFQEKYGAYVIHAWGMTEMSPLGTTGMLKPAMYDWPVQKRLDIQQKQGRAVYGVDMKIVDDEGREMPRDGKAFGRLLVRGPWITSGYFKGEGGSVIDREDWFDTGDVATLDADGFMQITDRSKDVIKSGGEWISSIDLENAAVGHADVKEACVIGIKHPKWQERPLLLVIRRPGTALDRAGMLKYLEGKVAKWWMPDDVVFVDELPHTATGKLLKAKLREEYADYKLPTA